MNSGNCPNCGAPITGNVCPYCNTRFENVADMALGETVTVSFQHDGWIYEFDMLVSGMNLDMSADTTVFYSDDMCVFTSLADPDYYAHFSGRVLKRDGSVYLVRKADG